MIAQFVTPFAALKYFVILLKDNAFMYPAVRDATLMTNDPNTLPVIVSMQELVIDRTAKLDLINAQGVGPL